MTINSPNSPKLLSLKNFVLYRNSKKSDEKPHNKKTLLKVHNDKHLVLYIGVLHAFVMFGDQLLHISNIRTCTCVKVAKPLTG